MKMMMFLALFAVIGCDDAAEKVVVVGSDGFHYTVAHGVGGKMENPSTGCPCKTIALGWSTYANKTNAAAHGVYSLYDAYRECRGSDDVSEISIADVWAFEAKLLEEWRRAE